MLPRQGGLPSGEGLARACLAPVVVHCPGRPSVEGAPSSRSPQRLYPVLLNDHSMTLREVAERSLVAVGTLQLAGRRKSIS